MRAALRGAMDALYWACMAISGLCLVAIAIAVPWGVFTRYVLNSAASWPEPFSILLTIVLTFLGGAACYRTSTHMRVMLVRGVLRRLDPLPGLVAETCVGLLGLYMVLRGLGLVQATWHDEVPEFPVLWVGLTYLPIPTGGACLLLFAAERLLIGGPQAPVAGRAEEV